MSSAASAFNAPIEALRALILREWPQLDAEAVNAAGGDRATLAQLVADATDHTRAWAENQLRELDELAAAQRRPFADRLDHVLRQLEGRAEDAASRVKQEVVPQAEQKIKENLLTSLLIVLGFGFLVGLLVGGSIGRGR